MMNEDLTQIRGSSSDARSKVVLGTGTLGLVLFMDRVKTWILPKHARKFICPELSNNRPNPSPVNLKRRG